MAFRSLGLDGWIEDVCKSLGMKKPTAVQEGCIPAILAGKDCMGSAETGSGKTAAFVLPILHKLARDPAAFYALLVTPTRELAFQIAEQVRAFGARMGVKEVVLVGGLNSVVQLNEVARKPHIIIGTPGRLVEIISNSGKTVLDLRRVQVLVLDEADRLLEVAFEDELDVIFEALHTRRQTLLFSATMTPSLEKLKEMNMTTCFRFDTRSNQLATVQGLHQTYVFMPERVRDLYVTYMLRERYTQEATIVFVGRCDTCELVARLLKSLGIATAALHSQLKQEARLGVLQGFRNSIHRILVATDVASRGLDIPAVDLVINYDLPSATETYVHRVGRTARAGRRGRAISMITQYDVDLVHAIEDKIGKKLEEEEGLVEKDVLDSLAEVFKARRVAKLEMTDNGFLDRLERKRKRKRERRG